MQKSLFISVEGIDGAGKSSHLNFIQEELESKGYSVIQTREPGGTVAGERIRELLLYTDIQLTRMTELYLLFASRQEVIKNIVKPNLDKGVSVLIDRFTDSSIAYQGYGRGVAIDKIETMISLLEPALKPDLTLLFDVDLEIAQQRLAKNAKADRIEQESQDFFARVRNGFHEIAKKDPNRVKVINTIQDKSATRQEIKRYLDALVGR